MTPNDYYSKKDESYRPVREPRLLPLVVVQRPKTGKSEDWETTGTEEEGEVRLTVFHVSLERKTTVLRRLRTTVTRISQ